jgi:nucleotide-binding universal stress UspA family protein
LLGSVTESVLHETNVPVLTVTPALMRHRGRIAIEKILCPVNFTRIAREAVGHASALAAAFDAELHVIYVAEAFDRERAVEVENAFRQWIDPVIADRCRFAPRLEYHEDAAEKVLVVAGDIGADMIVIGAQHRFFSDATIIGTTTQRITRFARVPVLTIARKAQQEITLHHEHEAAALM